MTENEAKIFIQNAMEQSRNVLAELMLIMPKVFAAKIKSLGEYYSNLENCKKEIQSCEVAIKALEECLAAMEKQTAKKIVRREATDEDIENELREFITRKGMIFQCPTCGCYIAVDGMKNCWDCGQKLDWSDEQ